MKFVVDESVSYAVVEKLRELKYEVVSVAKDFASLKDRDVHKLAVAEKAILITRDHHFTNSIRFPPEKTNGIVYIRQRKPQVRRRSEACSRIRTKVYTKRHREFAYCSPKERG